MAMPTCRLPAGPSEPTNSWMYPKASSEWDGPPMSHASLPGVNSMSCPGDGTWQDRAFIFFFHMVSVKKHVLFVHSPSRCGEDDLPEFPCSQTEAGSFDQERLLFALESVISGSTLHVLKILSSQGAWGFGRQRNERKSCGCGMASSVLCHWPQQVECTKPDYGRHAATSSRGLVTLTCELGEATKWCRFCCHCHMSLLFYIHFKCHNMS